MKYKLISFIKKNKVIFSLLLLPALNKKELRNTVVLIKKDGRKVYNPIIKKLKIKFNGLNNHVEIQEPMRIREHLEVYISGNNNFLNIGKECRIYNARILLGQDTAIKIGDNVSIGKFSTITALRSKNCHIKIGNNCMISYNVTVRTSDSHIIYDIETKEMINPSQSVVLGNHVWLAAGSTCLKGTHIADNSVVGLGSIVNKNFYEPNCILAGVPAKIVRRGINWNRKSTDSWEDFQSQL